ncbi:di-heme-cytochrome C peroxidase [Marilutibacter aestuarii]|nr:di-heme-cytochrome C peroxidase [Lysobacter aestuarii]
MHRIAAACRRLLDVRLRTLLKVALGLALALGLLAVAGFWAFVALPAHSIPEGEAFEGIVYLDQGWGEGPTAPGRQTYYYTPQGASIPQGEALAPLRYDWFVHLEMPTGLERFADPAHMRRYRFLVDDVATPANPDRLPVGFTRHFDPLLGEEVLDITCAACHTGELIATKGGRRVAVRIDGGQAMHAFTDMQRGSFAPTLLASLIATWSNPAKFDRFARKVIGARYPAGKDALHAALGDTVVAILRRGQNNPLRHLYPVREGFGRTDALGRIANTVFGDHLVKGNYQEAGAPVSYPYLWNIWKFDWVQYNGSVSQPLARNVGEALGVGATLRMTNTHGGPLPASERFRSSVMIPNLATIEHTLQTLQPPRWPEDLLGRIDRPLAERGRRLFERHCRDCHGPHPAGAAEQAAMAPLKREPGTVWKIEVIPLSHIGTDATAATGFLERRYDLTAAGLDRQEIDGLLRPLMQRELVRDTRYRLSAVVDGRRAAGLEADALAAELETYPLPGAGEPATVPAARFAAIAALLEADGIEAPHTAPDDPPDCNLDCQGAHLAWNVVRGRGEIDTELAMLDPAALSEGRGLNLLGLLVKRRWFEETGADARTRECLEGFGTLDLPQEIAGYKPRPLEGVWATPPFLHNGSVPNLYEMLLPPEQRSVRFPVGQRDYDSVHVGFRIDLPDDGEGFWLDTREPGNRNTGHGFTATPEMLERHHQDPRRHPLPPGVIGPLLADAERMAIIEYLKVHRDTPATPAGFQPPSCLARVAGR